MAFNDLFRMVSLRHSRASRDGSSTPRRDPRLRYQPILKEQAKSAASTSPRETKLQDLKNRHAELSKKLGQLESVQRAVIDAYMSEQQQEASKTDKPTRRSAVTHNPSHSVSTSTALTVIDNRGHFFKRVEKRLNK